MTQLVFATYEKLRGIDQASRVLLIHPTPGEAAIDVSSSLHEDLFHLLVDWSALRVHRLEDLLRTALERYHLTHAIIVNSDVELAGVDAVADRLPIVHIPLEPGWACPCHGQPAVPIGFDSRARELAARYAMLSADARIMGNKPVLVQAPANDLLTTELVMQLRPRQLVTNATELEPFLPITAAMYPRPDQFEIAKEEQARFLAELGPGIVLVRHELAKSLPPDQAALVRDAPLDNTCDERCLASDFDFTYATLLGSAGAVGALCGLKLLNASELILSVCHLEAQIAEWKIYFVQGELPPPSLFFDSDIGLLDCAELKSVLPRVQERPLGPLQITTNRTERPGPICPPMIARMAQKWRLPNKDRVAFMKALMQWEYDNLRLRRLRYRAHIPTVLAEPKIRLTNHTRPVSLSALSLTRIEQCLPLSTAHTKLEVASLVPSRGAIAKWHQRIGILLTESSVAGLSNILFGLHERCVVHSSRMLVFKGPNGWRTGEYVMLSRDTLTSQLNSPGLDLIHNIGLGVVSVETLRSQPSALEDLGRSCSEIALDGLVLVGGRRVLELASDITELFLEKGIPTNVICVPASAEFNCRHPLIEMSVGFHSHCAHYAHYVGKLYRELPDSWVLVDIPGVEPSLTAVEVAFRTHVDFVGLSDEYSHIENPAARIRAVVADVKKVMIKSRARQKSGGIVLCPTDLLETAHCQSREALEKLEWTSDERSCLQAAGRRLGTPAAIITTLLEGCVGEETSDISDMVLRPDEVLRNWGLSVYPSNFDCALATAHGYMAGVLIECGVTGYLTSFKHLNSPSAQWKPMAVPVAILMNEQPAGEGKVGMARRRLAARDKLLVDLGSHIGAWRGGHCYREPGPLQFDFSSGDRPLCLELEYRESEELQAQVAEVCRGLSDVCGLDVPDPILQSVLRNLLKLKSLVSDLHFRS